MNDKIFRIILNISIVIFLVGLLSEIMNWQYVGQYSTELLALSYFGFGFSYLGIFMQKEWKTISDLIQITCLSTWAVLNIFLLVGFVEHTPFYVITRVFFMTWFVLRFIVPEDAISFLSKRLANEDAILQLVLGVGIAAFVVGFLSQILV